MHSQRGPYQQGVNSWATADSGKLRSHSSPDLLPGDHLPTHGNSSAHPSGTAAGAVGSGAAAPAMLTAASDAQFQAATAVVATCNDLTRRLTQQADKARLFREPCSVVLAAGHSASLALHTALLHQQGSGMQVALLAGQVQSGLTQALTLVEKYGHASRLENLFRSTSKAEVEGKMGDAAAFLGSLAEQVWDLITPDNTIKRSLLAAQPHTEDRPLGAVLMDRRRLRPACQRPITALAVLPEGDEEDDYEGCVAWASSRGIKVTRLGPTISSVMDGSVDAPPVTTLTGGSPGQLWSGHADGSVRLWSVAAAVAAAVPIKVGNTPITALAWDPTTGHTWAGTAEGEISVIRMLLDGSSGGRLELVRSLLGPEAAPGGSALPGAGGATGAVGVSLVSQGSHDSTGSGKPLIKQQQQAAAAAEADPGGAASLRGSWELLESCLGAGGAGERLRDPAVHKGPVVAICCRGGRAWSIGGTNRSTVELLVWDSSRYELLRVVSKRATPHLNSQATAMAVVATPVYNRSSTHHCHAPSGGLQSASSWGGTSSTGGPQGAGPGMRSDLTLVTGHKDGSTLLWDISGDNARPLLSVLPRGRHAVRCLGMAEQLGLLVVGHTNGKVYLRQLDAAVARSTPVRGAQLPRWSPPSICLTCHRLRLCFLAVGPHQVLSSGQSNSVKLWPEARLRTMASSEGLRLPPSQDLGVAATMRMLAPSSAAGMLAARLSSSWSLASSGHRPSGPLHPATSAALATSYQTHLTRVNSTTAARSGLAQLAGAGSVKDGVREAVAVAATAASTPAAGGGRGQQHSSGSSVAQPGADGRDPPSLGAASGAAQKSEPAAADRADTGSPTALAGADSQATPTADESSSSSSHAVTSSTSVALSQWRALRALRRQGSSGIVRSSALDRDWVLDRDAVSFKHAIGSGAYGCVYLGTLHETDVAIKMLQGGVPASGAAAGSSAPPGVAWQQLQELAAEVEVLASLHHPNVVLFMGVILSPPCVVTEFCPMRSMFDVLERAWHEPPLAKRLNWPRRLLMALDAARGMLALHEHVVPILHTDLKSPNLFVDNGLRVKVGDFNLSRFLSKGSQFVQSSQMVNPRWCAPEVIEVGHYSKAADVYAFGIILWELLTWQQPWEQRGGPRGGASTLTAASTAIHATGLPMNSWQIMSAVKGAQRPLVPPVAELPGGAPPPQLLSEYVALMEACWNHDPTMRPNFKTIIAKLRTLLGAVRTPGGGAAAATAAAAAAGSDGPSSVVEPASNGCSTAAATQAGLAADSSAPKLADGAAEAPAPRCSPSAAAPSGGSSSCDRAAVSPAIADLLNLGDEDGQHGTSSSSRHATPRATTAVGCQEHAPASLPRKTSGPRVSPFASVAAAAAVGDVSDTSTAYGCSSSGMGFAEPALASTTAPAATAAAAAAAQSPFAAVDVQQQRPLPSGSLSGSLAASTQGAPTDAASAATLHENAAEEQQRAASLTLLGDELPISTMVPAAAPAPPMVPATTVASAAAAAAAAAAMPPVSAAGTSASAADLMLPWMGPPVQHSQSFGSSTMWFASHAGPSSFSAPRHVQSTSGLPHGPPVWQHGWYQQHPFGQPRPQGPHQQQPQPQQQPQQQQQQQPSAVRRR